MATALLRASSPLGEFSQVLSERQPFKTHGSLYGVAGDAAPHNKGRLPHEYWTSYYQASYAVYSYYTPIAWYYEPLGQWYMPAEGYSPTTKRHQNKIAAALGLFAEVEWI